MSDQESPMTREAAERWAKRRAMGQQRFIMLYAFLLLGGPVFCFHVGKLFLGVEGSSIGTLATWSLTATVTGAVFGHWLWRFNEGAYSKWCEEHGEVSLEA